MTIRHYSSKNSNGLHKKFFTLSGRMLLRKYYENFAKNLVYGSYQTHA